MLKLEEVTMKNAERYRFTEYVDLSHHDLTGNIRTVINILEDIVAKHGEDVYIDVDVEDDGYNYYNCGCHPSVTASYVREETDEEYEQRIEAQKEARRAQQREAYRRRKERQEFEKETYLRLKKKFEKEG